MVERPKGLLLLLLYGQLCGQLLGLTLNLSEHERGLLVEFFEAAVLFRKFALQVV